MTKIKCKHDTHTHTHTHKCTHTHYATEDVLKPSSQTHCTYSHSLICTTPVLTSSHTQMCAHTHTHKHIYVYMYLPILHKASQKSLIHTLLALSDLNGLSFDWPVPLYFFSLFLSISEWNFPLFPPLYLPLFFFLLFSLTQCFPFHRFPFLAPIGVTRGQQQFMFLPPSS